MLIKMIYRGGLGTRMSFVEVIEIAESDPALSLTPDSGRNSAEGSLTSIGGSLTTTDGEGSTDWIGVIAGELDGSDSIVLVAD